MDCGTLREAGTLVTTRMRVAVFRFTTLTEHGVDLPAGSAVCRQVREVMAGADDRLRVAVCTAELRRAVNTAVASALMIEAETVKFAEVAPGATATVAGAVNKTELLAKATDAPAGGAGSFRVTVQMPLPAETSVAGLQLSDDNPAGPSRVMEAVCDEPFRAATTVAVWSELRLPAVAANVTEVAPAGAVTVDGIDSAEVLLDKEIVVGVMAAVVSVTVQVPALLEFSFCGVHDVPPTWEGASTVTEKVVLLPFRVAVSDTLWFLLFFIVPVVAVKVADVTPTGTVTAAGTESTLALLWSATAPPPAGAVAVSVTVHDALLLEGMLVGVQVREETATGTDNVSAVDTEPPLSEAVTATVWVLVTVPAEAGKVAVVAAAAMVTVAGTVTVLELSDTDTLAPPEGAGCVRVMVQLLEVLEARVFGVH